MSIGWFIQTKEKDCFRQIVRLFIINTSDVSPVKVSSVSTIILNKKIALYIYMH